MPLAAERTGRVENRTMPASTVIPELTYDDVTEAIVWLCDKFGFVERWRAGDHRAQLSIGNGTVAITEPRTSNVRPGPRDIMVRVDDAAGHCERARARGATIVSEPRDYPYGERQYTAEDLGGHHWCFSQSIADVAPEEWGGTTGPALESPPRPPSISVMLIVPDAEAAIAWYYDALGADVLWNLGGVAGLHVAGAPFFLHEINPRNPTETSADRRGSPASGSSCSSTTPTRSSSVRSPPARPLGHRSWITRLRGEPIVKAASAIRLATIGRSATAHRFRLTRCPSGRAATAPRTPSEARPPNHPVEPRPEQRPRQRRHLLLVLDQLADQAGQRAGAHDRLEAGGVGGNRRPLVREVGADLDVELDSVRAVDDECLLLVGVRARQLHGAGRQRERVAMPLQGAELLGEEREHRIGRRRGGSLDREHAHFGRRPGHTPWRRGWRPAAAPRGTRPKPASRRQPRPRATRFSAMQPRKVRSSSYAPIGPPIATIPSNSRQSGSGSPRSTMTRASDPPRSSSSSS